MSALALCAVFSSPSYAANPAPLAELQPALEQAISDWGYDVAIAITDLQTGETVSVRGAEPRLTGCTINLLVLIQVTRDVQDGLILQEEADWMVESTIWGSDATLARELLFMVGGGDLAAGIARVNDLGSLIGLSALVYDHPPAFEEDSGGGLDNRISAEDMNRLLAALWRQELLAPEWTDHLLRQMRSVSPGLQYLVASSGDGTAMVSHKNGFYWSEYGYVDADAGIVTFWVGDVAYSYAVSYFAADVAEEFGDIWLGQRLMALAWAFFQARYGEPLG